MGKNFRYYRLIYTLFAFVTLCLLLWFQFLMASPIIFNYKILQLVLAMLLIIPGLIIMVISIKKYFLQVSGIRTLFATTIQNHLETGGLHRFVRHPLYFGTILFIWGLLFLLPTLSNAIAVLVITSYVLVGVRLEERKLVLEFGGSYKRYQANVPMLFPGISRKH
ncbi:MAG: isoprenylcysteine carboxylmethyltransferase family protein [Ginsengibacter sp.]